MNPLSITVLNPALWAGAAVLLAPLIVHLLTRRRARRLVFPTVRFLRQSRAEQSALYRLRHLVLLLLRTLFLLFLLLAFLRPIAHRAADTPANGATRVVPGSQRWVDERPTPAMQWTNTGRRARSHWRRNEMPICRWAGLGASWSTVGSHKKASNVHGSAPSCFMSTQALTPSALSLR